MHAACEYLCRDTQHWEFVTDLLTTDEVAWLAAADNPPVAVLAIMSGLLARCGGGERGGRDAATLASSPAAPAAALMHGGRGRLLWLWCQAVRECKVSFCHPHAARPPKVAPVSVRAHPDRERADGF